MLLSLASATAPQFEEMYRGDTPFSPAPMAAEDALDFSSRRLAYYKRHGEAEFRQAAREHVRQGMVTALADAGVQLGDPRIRCVALPRLGKRPIDIMFGEVVEEVLRMAKLLWLGDRRRELRPRGSPGC